MSFKRLNRRQLFQTAAGLTLFAPHSIPAPIATARSGLESNDLVVRENERPGTTEWQLTYVRSRNQRSQLIEGYCSKTSVLPGDSIDLFVSADPATAAVIDIYRMGYYGVRVDASSNGSDHLTSPRSRSLPSASAGFANAVGNLLLY